MYWNGLVGDKVYCIGVVRPTATTSPARSCAPPRTRRPRLPAVHHHGRPRRVARSAATCRRPSSAIPPAARRPARSALPAWSAAGRAAGATRWILLATLLLAVAAGARLPAHVAAAGDGDVGEHGADDRHRRHRRLKRLAAPAAGRRRGHDPRPRRGAPRYGYPPVVIHRVSRSRRTAPSRPRATPARSPTRSRSRATALDHPRRHPHPGRRPGARLPRQPARPALARRAAASCSSACRCSTATARHSGGGDDLPGA